MNKYKILNEFEKCINYNDFCFNIGDLICFDKNGSYRKATQFDKSDGIITNINEKYIKASHISQSNEVCLK
jgi:hypothetical protein